MRRRRPYTCSVRRAPFLALLWLSSCSANPGHRSPDQPRRDEAWQPPEASAERGPGAGALLAQQGCAAPEEVFFAIWEPKGAGASPPEEAEARAPLGCDDCWRLPLGHVNPGDGPPAPGAIDPDALAQWGIEPLIGRAWLYRDGARPCAGEVVAYVSEHVDAWLATDAISETYQISALVGGCAPPDPSSSSEGWVMSSPTSTPPPCTLSPPTRRLAPTQLARSLDVPTPYAALEPAGSCSGCRYDWQITEFAVAPILAQVKISRVSVDPRDEDSCNWESTTVTGQYVFANEGPPLALDPPGGDPSMRLVGVFSESGQAELLLYQVHGRWSVHRLESGRLGDGVSTTYRRSVSGECGHWQCCCDC